GRALRHGALAGGHAVGAGLALVAHAGVLLVGRGLGLEAAAALRAGLAALLSARGPSLHRGLIGGGRRALARLGGRRPRVGLLARAGPAAALVLPLGAEAPGALDPDAAAGP